MIAILSDPSHVIQVSPEIISRWLATECPNNFQLQRRDFIPVDSYSDSGSPEYLQLEFSSDFTGAVGDIITVYNSTNGAMYVGTVTAIASPATVITTSIPWVAGFVAGYLNDNTLHAGYYFEGRLTVNDVVQDLTVIASPDSFGKANLDVSGVLRLMTSLNKTGDNTSLVMSETTKSGKFTLEYRECWYGQEGAYTAEGNTWYYVEAVRSAEQGSNLYEFVATEISDAPFMNAFSRPVCYAGFPFDISLIFPETAQTSPEMDVTVQIKVYNAARVLLTTITTLVPANTIRVGINSLNIDTTLFPVGYHELTAEITTP